LAANNSLLGSLFTNGSIAESPSVAAIGGR
jgi:hypothetical protein